ncbi:MAG TPA: hypothetical protein VF916_13360, partial [Ktedonobacterales bacterium]
TGSQGRALLVGERTDKDGRSHTSQDTPFRPTFTEIALGRKDEAHVARQHEYAARRATGVPEWMPRDEGGTP